MSAFSKKDNTRRCNLIDKEVDGVITVWEKIELENLQARMLKLRKQKAPLPIEEARQTLKDLRELQ